MKTYIGTKIVQAEPALNPKHEGLHVDAEEGYTVVYEDGYRSWSPKDVFERCYREITVPEADLVKSGDSG